MLWIKDAIQREADLAFLILAAVLLGLVVYVFPSSPLRLILGLPFLAFSPGYSVLSALFPEQHDRSYAERIALGLGLSVFVVAAVGLLLDAVWAITLVSVLAAVGGLVVVCSAVAWYRRSTLPHVVRDSQQRKFGANPKVDRWLSRCLAFIVAAALLASAGFLAYALAVPRNGEAFTEFYLLDQDGQSIAYPQALSVGEQSTIIAGIINREQEPMTYSLATTLDGRNIAHLESIELASSERWQDAVTIAPTTAGAGQKVEFAFYKEGGPEPCARLHIWVDVTEQ
jgi:uncharacterized membrane protein